MVDIIVVIVVVTTFVVFHVLDRALSLRLLRVLSEHKKSGQNPSGLTCTEIVQKAPYPLQYHWCHWLLDGLCDKGLVMSSPLGNRFEITQKGEEYLAARGLKKRHT